MAVAVWRLSAAWNLAHAAAISQESKLIDSIKVKSARNLPKPLHQPNLVCPQIPYLMHRTSGLILHYFS